MLVLTRKKDQTIVISNDIEVTVLDIQGDQVRIGINAPRSVSIHRKEVFLEIQQENKNAAQINSGADKVSLDDILKNSNK